MNKRVHITAEEQEVKVLEPDESGVYVFKGLTQTRIVPKAHPVSEAIIIDAESEEITPTRLEEENVSVENED